MDEKGVRAVRGQYGDARGKGVEEGEMEMRDYKVC